MTAREHIDSHAKLFGWGAYEGDLREMIYLRGDVRVHVQYSSRGAVVSASKFRQASFAPGSSVLLGVADGRNRQTAVTSWLVED